MNWLRSSGSAPCVGRGLADGADHRGDALDAGARRRVGQRLGVVEGQVLAWVRGPLPPCCRSPPPPPGRTPPAAAVEARSACWCPSRCRLCWIACDEPLPTATSMITARDADQDAEHRQRGAQSCWRSHAASAAANAQHLADGLMPDCPPAAETRGRRATGDRASAGRPRSWSVDDQRITRLACAATSSSWVIRTMVRPAGIQLVEDRSTSSVDLVSRLPVGSSASSSDGAVTRARATATRCCWPPESSFGSWSIRSASPTCCRAASALACAARRRLDPAVGQRQLDVGQRAHARDQVERLEDEADLAVAQRRRAAGRRARRTSMPSSR